MDTGLGYCASLAIAQLHRPHCPRLDIKWPAAISQRHLVVHLHPNILQLWLIRNETIYIGVRPRLDYPWPSCKSPAERYAAGRPWHGLPFPPHSMVQHFYLNHFSHAFKHNSAPNSCVSRPKRNKTPPPSERHRNGADSDVGVRRGAAPVQLRPRPTARSSWPGSWPLRSVSSTTAAARSRLFLRPWRWGD